MWARWRRRAWRLQRRRDWGGRDVWIGAGKGGGGGAVSGRVGGGGEVDSGGGGGCGCGGWGWGCGEGWLREGGGRVDGWTCLFFLFFKVLLNYLLTACVPGLWVVAVVVLFHFSSIFFFVRGFAGRSIGNRWIEVINSYSLHVVSLHRNGSFPCHIDQSPRTALERLGSGFIYQSLLHVNLKASIVNEISSGPETATPEMNFLQATHSPTINIHRQSSNHAVSTILSAKLAS